MISRVYLSYSRKDLAIALTIKNNLEPDFEIWIDQTGIQFGQRWMEKINKAIIDAVVVVVLVTPDALRSSFVTYEWQFALGAGLTVIPLECKELRPGFRKDFNGDRYPNKILSQLQGMNFMKPTPAKWAELKHRLEQIDESNIRRGVRNAVTAANDVEERNVAFKENPLFARTITQSFNELATQINDALGVDYFNIPASQYPNYLIALHKTNVQIKATAIVDQEELFWFGISDNRLQLGRPGIAITINTPKESTRVFVFDTSATFERCYNPLRQFCESYDVRVISKKKFIENSPQHAVDYAVFNDGKNKILVYYNTDRNTRTVRFSANSNDIHEYEVQIDRIISKSNRVCDFTDDIEAAKQLVFE